MKKLFFILLTIILAGLAVYYFYMALTIGKEQDSPHLYVFLNLAGVVTGVFAVMLASAISDGVWNKRKEYNK